MSDNEKYRPADGVGKGIAVAGVWAAVAAMIILGPPTLSYGWLVFAAVAVSMSIY